MEDVPDGFTVKEWKIEKRLRRAAALEIEAMKCKWPDEITATRNMIRQRSIAANLGLSSHRVT